MLNLTHRFVSECVSLVLNMRQRFCYFANGSASVAVVLLFILTMTYVVWMVFNSDLNYDSPNQRSHLILDHLHDLIQRWPLPGAALTIHGWFRPYSTTNTRVGSGLTSHESNRWNQIQSIVQNLSPSDFNCDSVHWTNFQILGTAFVEAKKSFPMGDTKRWKLFLCCWRQSSRRFFSSRIRHLGVLARRRFHWQHFQH